jgi:tight adherence protein B
VIRSSAAIGLMALSFLLTLGGAVAAQPQGLTIDAIDPSGHPEVTLTVTAPSDMLGTALTSGSFAVLENGQRRPVQVEPLHSDDLRVIILIDTSGSMGSEPMEAARQAAVRFVEQLPDSVAIAVTEFNTEPLVVADFSTDHAAIVTAIQGLQSGGNTALNDAVLLATEQFREGAQDGRQAIVLLSDGGDTSSEAGLATALDAVQAASVQLHVVELQTAESDLAALQALAAAGQGRLVSTTDPAALGSLYEELASVLVNQYRLVYESGAYGRTSLAVLLSHGATDVRTDRTVTFPAAPAAAVPEPAEPQTRAGQLLAMGWINEPWVPYAGIAAGFLAIAVFLLVILVPRRPESQLASDGRTVSRESGLDGLRGLGQQLAGAAERMLSRGNREPHLDAKLERAGITMRSGEYVVLSTGTVLLTLAILWLFGGTLVALVGAALVGIGSKVLLDIKATKRQDAFRGQLGDTLQLMAGSLRSGYGLLQAVDSVARESDEPTAAEFRRLLVETRLGRDLDDCLNGMAQRIQLEDFDWVVQGIEIHRQVGGDLAEVLDAIAGTIRERDHIRREIKSLSAEGRISAIILVALPFVIMAAMSALNPGYLGELTGHPVGWVMLAMAGGLIVVGALWIRRLVKLVF